MNGDAAGRPSPAREVTGRYFSAGYIAAATAATFAGAYGPKKVAALTKPLPLALLGVQAGRQWQRRPGVDSALLLGALGFSAAGDRAMFLEEFSPTTADDARRRAPRTVPLTPKDRRLAWGATLFSGAQLCYSTALWRRGARPHVASLLPRLAVLAESAGVIAFHRPRLLSVLGPYGNTLATMSALAADDPQHWKRLRLGGILFLASDLTILNRRHLLTNPRLRQLAEVWVLASYFAAQALLVNGLLDQQHSEG